MSATATATALTSPARGWPGRPPARRPGIWVPVAAGGAAPGVAAGVPLAGTSAPGAAIGRVTGVAGQRSTLVGAAGAGTAGEYDGNASVIGAGSQPAAGRAALSSARNCSVLGRCSGSLARHRSTSGRSPAGRPVVSGGVKTTRYSSVALGAVPNGP
jgi:hypothetical protein